MRTAFYGAIDSSESTFTIEKGFDMRFHSEKAQFDLHPQNIDRLSEWLDARFSAVDVRREDRIRVRFLTEEILLRMQARLGEDAPVEAYFEKSFGRPALHIEIAGEAFNPLNEAGNSLGDWNDALITAVNIDPKYTYSWGKNVLRFVLPGKKINPVLQIAVAIAIGCALGILGALCLPDEARENVTQTLFSPVYDVWIRILNALSGPVIFFMVITTIINTKKITRQGGTKLYVIGRYFLFSLLAAGVTVVCAVPFLGRGVFAINSPTEILKNTLDALLKIFPNNIFEPFIDSNTPQLLLIAFFIGSAMIVLGNHVSRLKTVVQQINMIGLLLAKWISLLVPFFTCIFLAFEIWQKRTELISQMWKPMLLSFVVTALVLCFASLWLAFRVRMSAQLVFRKLFDPFWSVLKTGSVDNAFDLTERTCTNALGIDRYFAGISLPQGLVLYMPVSSVGVLAFTLFACDVYGLQPNIGTLIGAVVFSVVLFVATPPVPGANLLAYIVLFSWLGIPETALIDAMIFDIVFGLLATAGNLTMLQIETVLQAKRIGLLDMSRLRSEKGVKK